MTYPDALSYIHSTEWKGSRPGLERISELLSRLGDPQKSLRFVHVAGTNGKGSTSVMLASVLTAAGYRVGLFTSPFLLEFRERIRIGERMISEEELVRAVLAVRPHADAMQDSPTEFELMTALAFWYFNEQNCDLVVCEVGLGGELDSTNVIESPLLSVITSIALDHTEVLGDTLEDVARAKAGIVKPSCPVLFCERENTPARRVIEAVASEKDAPLFFTDPASLRVQSCDLAGTVFSYQSFSDLRLSLPGAYQPRNAAAALSAVLLLREAGLKIPPAAVRAGLASAVWPGRFEVLSRDPVVILDGAHNPHGARALADSLHACLDAQVRFLAVAAVMRDKDYRTLFELLAERIECVFCVSPEGHERALEAKKLAAECGKLGMDSRPYPSVEEGVRAAFAQAKSSGMPLLVFGSLYLYRQARGELVRLLGR